MKSAVTFTPQPTGDLMSSERQRVLKQQGHSELDAMKLALGKDKRDHGIGAGKGAVSTPNKVNVGGPIHRPPAGFKLNSLSIHPAHSGVIVRHSYSPVGKKVGSEGGISGPQYQPDAEHAFGTSEEAMDHVNAHLPTLFSDQE